jgi:hypothetical protein
MRGNERAGRKLRLDTRGRGPGGEARNRYASHARRYHFASLEAARSAFLLFRVVDSPYTTGAWGSTTVAFLRRRGNAYYLVHNVRRGGKVKQLHLACLGDRPRLTDDVVRSVRRNHPLLELNWRQLRERLHDRSDLLVADTDYVKKLAQHLHKLNLELADLAPQSLGVGVGPNTVTELVALLRLLRSTVEIKLRQFDRVALTPGSRRALR